MHWSAPDPKPAPRGAPHGELNPDQAAAPPPLAPILRVAELFQALFNLERDLTAELLQELGNCSTEDLVKLFGPVPTKTLPAYGPPAADVSTVDTLPAEPVPTWSADGRRLNPGRRAFNYFVPQMRGSHWGS